MLNPSRRFNFYCLSYILAGLTILGIVLVVSSRSWLDDVDHETPQDGVAYTWLHLQPLQVPLTDESQLTTRTSEFDISSSMEADAPIAIETAVTPVPPMERPQGPVNEQAAATMKPHIEMIVNSKTNATPLALVPASAVPSSASDNAMVKASTLQPDSTLKPPAPVAQPIPLQDSILMWSSEPTSERSTLLGINETLLTIGSGSNWQADSDVGEPVSTVAHAMSNPSAASAAGASPCKTSRHSTRLTIATSSGILGSQIATLETCNEANLNLLRHEVNTTRCLRSDEQPCLQRQSARLSIVEAEASRADLTRELELSPSAVVELEARTLKALHDYEQHQDTTFLGQTASSIFIIPRSFRSRSIDFTHNKKTYSFICRSGILYRPNATSTFRLKIVIFIEDLPEPALQGNFFQGLVNFPAATELYLTAYSEVSRRDRVDPFPVPTDAVIPCTFTPHPLHHYFHMECTLDDALLSTVLAKQPFHLPRRSDTDVNSNLLSGQKPHVNRTVAPISAPFHAENIMALDSIKFFLMSRDNGMRQRIPESRQQFGQPEPASDGSGPLETILTFERLAPKKPRYNMAQCVRPLYGDSGHRTARYASELIANGLAVGIEHFYLYTRTLPHYAAALAPYINEGLVTMIWWPYWTSTGFSTCRGDSFDQSLAMADCALRNIYDKYLVMADLDELVGFSHLPSMQPFTERLGQCATMYANDYNATASCVIERGVATYLDAHSESCPVNQLQRWKYDEHPSIARISGSNKLLFIERNVVRAELMLFSKTIVRPSTMQFIAPHSGWPQANSCRGENVIMRHYKMDSLCHATSSSDTNGVTSCEPELFPGTLGTLIRQIIAVPKLRSAIHDFYAKRSALMTTPA